MKLTPEHPNYVGIAPSVKHVGTMTIVTLEGTLDENPVVYDNVSRADAQILALELQHSGFYHRADITTSGLLVLRKIQ